MGFDKIIYRLTDKRIPAATGIGLVGEILERAGFQEQFRNEGRCDFDERDLEKILLK